MKQKIIKYIKDKNAREIANWQNNNISEDCSPIFNLTKNNEKAQEIGYHPEIILSGRRMNDSMGSYVISEVVKLMVAKEIPIKGAKALLLGITFKENCPDIRNTKAIDIYKELQTYHMNVDLFDPWANAQEVKREFGIELKTSITNELYDTIILAVAHKEFLTLDLSKMRKKNSLIYDIKGVLDKQDIDKRL